ncbi:hypothetical protein ACQEVB_21600 [Pseudonocardia sp. CA-107938]|uniref:hypothetical protein n=1 Tax=Pseudonocardia sp. CA-107938 TaxID=3240021 RepID=UPI003D916939
MTSLRAALAGALPGHPAAFGLVEPEGPGWHPLPGLDVARWCPDDSAATALGLAEVLGTAVVGRLVAALALTGSAFDPADLQLHRHERGFVDAVALCGSAMVDDPAARTVAVLGPVLDAVVAATRPAPLWDVVADSARGAATTLALHGHHGAHAVADALVAGFAAHGVPVRPAHREQVAGVEVAVRVTCCLLWTTVPAAERDAAYCSTCPHLDAGARAARFRRYAEEAGGGAAPG